MTKLSIIFMIIQYVFVNDIKIEAKSLHLETKDLESNIHSNYVVIFTCQSYLVG